MLNRRHFLNSSALALAGAALARVPVLGQAASGGAAQAPPPPAPKFMDLRRNVGYFTGQGGTIGWLATPDGAVAVDSQFPATAQACVDGLKQKSPSGIQLLINTHYHGDHVGGNPVFRGAVKTIVQQERCAQLHREMTTKAGTAEKQAFADVTFGESWSTSIGDEKVWGYYYGPAHTGGDAVIVFERANVVHMGDLMFNKLHPRVDRPGGASMRNWMQVLERVAQKHKDATFIFGHAKAGLDVTGTAKELLALRDYLGAALEHAQRGIKAGQTLDQIAAAESLPKFEDYASSGQVLTLKGTLTAAYEELTQK